MRQWSYCCQAPSPSPLGASGLREKVWPRELSTCAHTRRRPHQVTWAPGGLRFSSLVAPSDLQLQATGHGAHAAWPNTALQPRWTEEVERNMLGSE